MGDGDRDRGGPGRAPPLTEGDRDVLPQGGPGCDRPGADRPGGGRDGPGIEADHLPPVAVVDPGGHRGPAALARQVRPVAAAQTAAAAFRTARDQDRCAGVAGRDERGAGRAVGKGDHRGVPAAGDGLAGFEVVPAPPRPAERVGVHGVRARFHEDAQQAAPPELPGVVGQGHPGERDRQRGVTGEAGEDRAGGGVHMSILGTR